MARAVPRRSSARRSPGGATRSSWSARSIRTTPRRKGTVAACERSLRRLRHRPASTSICCTGAARIRWRRPSAAFERLQRAGKIRHWGVSNLDADDMEELAAVPGGAACATDQVLYNLVAARPRMGSAALVPRARHAGHGLQPDRAGPAGRRSGAWRRSAAAGGCGPSRWRWPGCWRSRACSRSPRPVALEHVEANAAALDIALTRRSWPRSTASSAARTAKQPLAML